MILEAIITSENADGSMHLSAIGPHVNAELTQWTIKPFMSSRTFANLRRSNRCVIHITDDALLLADCVTGSATEVPARFDSQYGYILTDACRVFALALFDWDQQEPRSSVCGTVTWSVDLRPFFGWNRAKHALLELAIDATRIDLLGSIALKSQLATAKTLVEKTGGAAEREALLRLERFILKRLDVDPASE